MQDVAVALAPYRRIAWLSPPATLESGDVLHIGRNLYVGRPSRTNDAGIEQLRELVQPHGYSVQAVDIRGCLHLKTACCYLGRNTILANSRFVERFSDCRLIEAPPEDDLDANVLLIGGTLVLPSHRAATGKLLERHGFKVLRVDLSEFQKAEAGPTCLSILFDLATQE